MENIKSCELCLKQIIKTEDFENLHCDEKQNLKILKDLDVTLSKDAKICSNCVNISHLTYNFKISCLTNNEHLKTLIHPGITDKLILEEVVMEETKSEFKNEKKVCRFCLNFSEVNSLVEVNLEQDVVLKDMLQRCLPEIDTNMVQNPLICSICSELLEKQSNFFSQCKDTEVLRNLDTNTDVLVNENMPTVAKNDDNIDNSFVKEENCEGIENPELQIKSENFDIDEGIKDSINESNTIEKKYVKPKPHGTIKEKKFVCDICSYQTNRNTNLKRHCLVHKEPSEVNIFQCDYCPFATKWKNSIMKHSIRHKNPSELPNSQWKQLAKSNQKLKEVRQHNPVEEKDVKPKPRGKIKKERFVCDICSHQTTKKIYLKQHFLTHKEPWEVNLFKCDYCAYATKWKRNLTAHTIRHKIPSEMPKFKCNDCPYGTNNRSYLVKHVGMHKNSSEMPSKEQKQPAKSNQKLKKVRQHNPVDEKDVKPKPRGKIKKERFVCDICSHQTTKKIYLKQHFLTHREPWEVNLFKCDYCAYATKWKRNLTAHTIRHKVPSEMPSKEWKQPAKSDQNLKKVRQHNPVEEKDVKPKPHATINEKRFVCDICSYQANFNSHLKRHYLVHKKLSQVSLFKCDYCPFATKWRNSIMVHTIRHENRSELPKFKCNYCPYETSHRQNLDSHVFVHKNHSQV